MATEITDKVKDYYGKRVKCQDDLQTKACIADEKSTPKYIKEILSQIHDEVMSRYYGCGLVIPSKLEEMKVLDLGSGSGRDCFVVSKLVGQNGHVTGIDMTEEQLEVARKHIPYHMEKFGYSKPNVEFVQGYIEKLTGAGIQENSQDIIISNCVVNLSPDKKAVISEAYQVLKEGGEFYFSDMYCDRDLSPEARQHEVLWGECFSGCLCWKDLYTFAGEVGFSSPRMVSTAPIDPGREDFKKILGDAKFVSTEYRLFKLPKTRVGPKEVVYKGTVGGCEKEFAFDFQTIFRTGEAVDVDSELATILTYSRYKDDFDIKPSSKTDVTVPNQLIDPFIYLEEKAKRGEKVAAPSCCAPKQEGPSCCGPKKEAPSCCGPKKEAPACCGGKKEASGCGNKKESGCCGGKKSC